MTMREAKREIVHGLQALIQYAHEWKAKCEAASRDAAYAWAEVSRVQQVGLRAESEAASLRAELAVQIKLANGALDAQAEAEKKWFAARAEANDVLQRAVEDRESSRRMKCQECGNAEGVHDSGHFGILCNDVVACNQRCVDAWDAAEVERLKDRSPA
jgi:hypothetical protein